MADPADPTTGDTGAGADTELREIIHRGAELIPHVRVLIAHATAADEATGELAHEIGATASAYLALRKKLWPRKGDQLADEVEQLLNFHQQILEQASILAFRPRSEHWAGLAARFGTGTSDSTTRLRQLARLY